MKGRKMKLKVALLAMVAFGGAATAVYAADRLEPSRVSALLNARLPKTQVSAIDCAKVAGLCDVVAAKTLFYVAGPAPYPTVAPVYDMAPRQDLPAPTPPHLTPAPPLARAHPPAPPAHNPPLPPP